MAALHTRRIGSCQFFLFKNRNNTSPFDTISISNSNISKDGTGSKSLE